MPGKVMSDFWAGYVSGAAGIIIGNPLDLIKVRLQAGISLPIDNPASFSSQFDSLGSLIKGATAPILGYGALNALLFVCYNRTLKLLDDNPQHPSNLWKIWSAGAVGGLATFVISAPTELIKCRTQVSSSDKTSFSIAKDIIRTNGVRGLFSGGTVTSLRDSIGYGFYFWSYELCKKCITFDNDAEANAAARALLCGGIAGIVTWASVFPLDVIKTRVQTQGFYGQPACLAADGREPLIRERRTPDRSMRLGAIEIARQTYRTEGFGVFFRGLGVCSARAFVVNAVQWAAYEWVMLRLKSL